MVQLDRQDECETTKMIKAGLAAEMQLYEVQLYEGYTSQKKMADDCELRWAEVNGSLLPSDQLIAVVDQPSNIDDISGAAHNWMQAGSGGWGTMMYRCTRCNVSQDEEGLFTDGGCFSPKSWFWDEMWTWKPICNF